MPFCSVRCSIFLIGAALVPGLPGAAVAEDQPPAAAPPASQGILPVPDYSGDLSTRNRLTGDWAGARTDLANIGIQFDVGLNQTFQAVTDGGRDTASAYGGSLDYVLNLDLMRMGVLPGALVKIRGESRFGESINAEAGPALAVNADAFFPLGNALDEDIAIAVTNLVYLQFLSEQFGVLVGKIDTFDGDPNEFSGGRGDTQFLNANFLFGPAAALVVPYSTLAVGVLWLPHPQVAVSSSVMNTVDSSTTSGFDDFGDGTTWSSEIRGQYKLFNLPGGQNAGFILGFDNDFAQIGTGRLVFRPGEGLSFTTSSDDETWAAYWSLWQYLWTEKPVEGLTDLANNVPDHQGVGVFLRVGVADTDTNPAEWTFSGGVGGRGVIPGRDDDTFGVGFFHMSLDTGRLTAVADIDDQTQGIEVFYNLAITPAAHLTFDLQVIDSPFPGSDTATIVGGRLRLAF